MLKLVLLILGLCGLTRAAGLLPGYIHAVPQNAAPHGFSVASFVRHPWPLPTLYILPQPSYPPFPAPGPAFGPPAAPGAVVPVATFRTPGFPSLRTPAGFLPVPPAAPWPYPFLK